MNSMLRTSEAIARFEQDGNLDREVMEAICLDASEATGAELVSIWSLNSARNRIKCQYAYDADGQNDPEGASIMRHTCPAYFTAVTEESGIIANRVAESPETRELVDGYFDVYGIKSLLDFILRKDGTPTGVICCESRAEKSWGTAELNFLRALATLASYHFHIDDSQ